MYQHRLPCTKLELMHDVHYQHGERVETELLEFGGKGILTLYQTSDYKTANNGHYHRGYKGCRVEQPPYRDTVNGFTLLVYERPCLPNSLQRIRPKVVQAKLHITKEAHTI